MHYPQIVNRKTCEKKYSNHIGRFRDRDPNRTPSEHMLEVLEWLSSRKCRMPQGRTFMRSALLFHFSQSIMVVQYRRFGTSCCVHLQGSTFTLEDVGCPRNVGNKLPLSYFQPNQPTKCSNFSSLLLVV